MNPAEIIAAVSVLEAAVTEIPALVTDLQKLFASGAPTAADFTDLRASIAAESYGQFVPASQLPPGETAS